MNKLLTKLIAVGLLISTAVSSLAVESRTTAPAFPMQAPLTTPTILSKKATLTVADLAKYQHLADQSHSLATQQIAGASDASKTALIVVGTIVVVVGVAALLVSHGGKGIDPGISFK